MGRPDPDQFIKHFSHPHPLKLLNLQSQSVHEQSCSCCNRDAVGWLYHCATCNYFLHKTCSKLPQELTHAADQNHKLILLPSPSYPEGLFWCNGCGGHGSGFCYHCSECQLDLHTICALMPESIKHDAHEHALRLCLGPPYETKSFNCDICLGPGSDHWLYRCDSCEFDAHMKCAKVKGDRSGAAPPPQVKQECTQERDLHLPHLTKSRSAPFQASPPQPMSDFSNRGQPSHPGHHFSPSMGPNSHQVPLGVPYSVPVNGYYNGAQGSQLGHSLTMPIVPQNGQAQRTHNILSDVIGHAVEGITGSLTQQLVESVVQGALGN